MDGNDFRMKIQDSKTKMIFEADSFYDFFEALNMINQAKIGGIHFVLCLIEEIKQRTGRKIKDAVYKALRQEQDANNERFSKQFPTGDQEFDNYRTRCIMHDWYHDYSDDGSVSRRGREVESELAKIAKEKGDKYKIYWDYANRTFRK